ncbi:hypothetical protein PS862_05260 [Pseudomonas fluorescens]|uniref:TonB-dependent receptor n=1 Tax=Pseudomonas fluorescens TaxID=294 RepID=A0A5E7PHA4_PSEFL|nr:hypothetical protein [Pseudomonas fluorescens]VVP48450.1 hypothetical protein PS862_05260 [Pseudomonas fluorescens]
MTARAFSKPPLNYAAESGVLRHAIRAALFSTALGVGLLPTLGFAAPGSEASSHRYHVAAGPLSDALNQFARQAGITLSTTPTQTQGLQSNESYVASCASLDFCYLGEERNVAATVSYQF